MAVAVRGLVRNLHQAIKFVGRIDWNRCAFEMARVSGHDAVRIHVQRRLMQDRILEVRKIRFESSLQHSMVYRRDVKTFYSSPS